MVYRKVGRGQIMCFYIYLEIIFITYFLFRIAIAMHESLRQSASGQPTSRLWGILRIPLRMPAMFSGESIIPHFFLEKH